MRFTILSFPYFWSKFSRLLTHEYLWLMCNDLNNLLAVSEVNEELHFHIILFAFWLLARFINKPVMLSTQRQWVASKYCIPTIIILVLSVVGFNILIGFAGERSKTDEVVIDSKDLSCVRIADSSSTGTFWWIPKDLMMSSIMRIGSCLYYWTSVLTVTFSSLVNTASS